MRRDCTCPKSRHEHGTVQGYANDDCHCPECRAAWAEYRRRQVRRKAQARWNRRPLYVSPIGTARRLQALAAVGWAPADLAPMITASTSQILKWRSGQPGWLYAETADRVAAVYAQVADLPPTGRYALKVRRCAARHGWLPPIAWDDDTIDDPDAQPYAGAPVELDEIAVERYVAGTLKHREFQRYSPELVEAIRILAGRRLTDAQIGERVGVHQRRIQGLRQEHGIPAGVAA